MLLVSKVSGPSEGFLAPYDFSGSHLDFFVYWGAVVLHVEVVVYSDPEVLNFSDLFYAFDMSERETCLCSPVGAHYLGVIESLLCCFIKGYYETLVVVCFCTMVLCPVLDYQQHFVQLLVGGGAECKVVCAGCCTYPLVSVFSLACNYHVPS